MKLLKKIFMILLPVSVAGQQFSSFNNTTFITDFPQNTVQSLFQDEKGYMWIGTESGLNMYDGKRVYNYKAGQNENFYLHDNTINNITADDKGRLWVATTGGVSVFNPFLSASENQRNKLLADSINTKAGVQEAECVRVLKNRKIVIGYRKALAMYDPDKHSVKAIGQILANNVVLTPFVVSLAEDEAGHILVLGDKEGLFIFNDDLQLVKHFSKSSITTGSPGVVHNLVCLGNNKIFLASNKGLFKTNLQTGTVVNVLESHPALRTVQVNHLAYDREKQVLMAGTNTKGFLVLDSAGTLLDHVMDSATNKKLYSNNVFFVYQDKNKLGWWIGTGQGLTRFFYKENLFSTRQLLNEDGSAMRTYPIYTEDNENLLIGTNTKLVRYNLRTNRQEDIPGMINTPIRYNYILKTVTGLYIFCTKAGLYCMPASGKPVIKKLSAIYPEFIPYDSANFLCGVQASETEILFGLRGTAVGGLLKWDIRGKNVTRFGQKENDDTGLSSNTINNIVRSSHGRYYLCTNEGVCVFNNKENTIVRLTPKGAASLSYPQCNALLEDGNILWIATYGGGLNKYYLDNSKIEYITETDGLSNNDLYSIHKTGDGNLWMSTNRGLSVYNPVTKKIFNYDKSNGLIDNEYNRTSYFQLGDTLYFGGLTGICWFNYKSISPSGISPFADITKIINLYQEHEETVFPGQHNRITLPYSRSTLKIILASPFFINPAKTVFRYRLLPNQKEWVSNGTTNELILTQVPSGKHTLEVRSVSSEGVESKNIRQLFITITPPWYQTRLFKILLGCLAAGILYGYYRLRINRLKKEQQIRNQFATDLHDDLGSTLNSIKVHSNLALMEKENTEHLQHVKQGAQDAISGVRDIIWVLDDKKDRVSDMLARVSQFARPLCEGHHIRYTVLVDDETAAAILGKEEKRNLYMIIKEFINNSIKYAQCRNITVNIERTGKQLTVMVSDDGAGFDAGSATAGNGLRNMAARAAAIHYRYSIISGKGNGTTITLEK